MVQSTPLSDSFGLQNAVSTHSHVICSRAIQGARHGTSSLIVERYEPWNVPAVFSIQKSMA
jgi:hypothetical protein